MAGGRPKTQYSQALRLLQIVEMLQHRGVITISELMNEFAINRRTVQRDIGVLNELYAIEEGERTGSNEKTFRLKESARGDTLKLTLTEMIGLYMGQNMFNFATGTELKSAVDSLYSKLQTRLSARNVAVRDRLPNKFYCTAGFPKSYQRKDDRLNDVLTALIDERKLAITYRIPKRAAYTDVVHPLTLVVHNQGLYVICHSERAQGIRLFAVERILRSKWRGLANFTYPAKYNPEAEIGSAFGISAGGKAQSVRLVFSSAVAPYVLSRQWHSSMRTQTRAGGSVEVRFSVVLGEELVHWVTGYGGEVRVLAPRELQQRVMQRHTEGCKKVSSRRR